MATKHTISPPRRDHAGVRGKFDWATSRVLCAICGEPMGFGAKRHARRPSIRVGDDSRFYPHADTPQARLLDRIAPITSMTLDDTNRQEWALREEFIVLVREIERVV